MTKLYRERRLQLIFGVTLMGVMGVSLISPVFPAIIEHFDISEQQISLVVTAYTLPGVFVALLIGVLADRFGRKPVLVPLLVLFGVAGTAIVFAPDFRTLLILRVFQGIGGAGLVTLSTTLIGDYYDGIERGQAMGLNASVLSVGTAAYPAIGGLTGAIGWWVPFLLYLVAVPMGLWALYTLVEPATDVHPSLREYTVEVGRIARKPATLAASMGAFLAFVLLYGGIITFFPVYLEREFGASTQIIGGLQTTMSIAVAIVASQAGRLASRFSEQRVFTVGFLAYALGLFLIPFMPAISLLVVPMVIFGVGQGLVVPNIQTFMTKIAPQQYRAATMSLYNISLRSGQTVGPLFFGSIIFLGFDRLYFTAGMIAVGGFVLLAIVAFLQQSHSPEI